MAGPDHNPKDTTMDLDPHIIAVHEAGHALMALMLGQPVTEIVVNDHPDEVGRLGHCLHGVATNWRDNLWITLAGPVVTAIHEGRSGVETFGAGDDGDFLCAWEMCWGLVCRPLPPEFHEVAGDDHHDFMGAVLEGWCPPGIKGQVKRRLTLYAKEYGQAADFACDLLHSEKDAVREWVGRRQWFMPLTQQLAGEFSSKSRMDLRDVLEFIKQAASRTAPQPSCVH